MLVSKKQYKVDIIKQMLLSSFTASSALGVHVGIHEVKVQASTSVFTSTLLIDLSAL